ncbi:MAG: DUF4293 domain-containing protein [Chitinophagaceae bacterium]|nr:DUF4293 domain-containing protein [Chitinophagaceae bacterium]
MIQRKQTLWLLLAALCSILTFYIPYGLQTVGQNGTALLNEIPLKASNSFVLAALSIITAIDCFAAIFMFKQRPNQIKLCALAIFIQLGSLAFQIYHAGQTELGNRLVIGILGSRMYLGVLVPVLVIALIGLAISGIRQDERLIKSTDRLR